MTCVHSFQASNSVVYQDYAILLKVRELYHVVEHLALAAMCAHSLVCIHMSLYGSIFQQRQWTQTVISVIQLYTSQEAS